ncbi:MAG TPA: c-type cytochrome, partial [Crenalkalicoccus sp.]|nr:c-type cytochrome [Crenalkalicoccus sp.]
MNSMEVNKAFAAVLTAGIAFMVTGLVGRLVVSPEHPPQPAIQIGNPEAAQPAGTSQPQAPQIEPVSPLLASANVQQGEQLAQRLCAVCHNFQEGGGPKVGPDLYDVVGRPHAAVAGFNYSAALKSKPGAWDYEELNHWLYKPASYAPGTRMAFAGIPNTQQ